MALASSGRPSGTSASSVVVDSMNVGLCPQTPRRLAALNLASGSKGGCC